MDCKHCRNGQFDNRFGEDVECVNGVLIDIDVAHEGWQQQQLQSPLLKTSRFYSSTSIS